MLTARRMEAGIGVVVSAGTKAGRARRSVLVMVAAKFSVSMGVVEDQREDGADALTLRILVVLAGSNSSVFEGSGAVAGWVTGIAFAGSHAVSDAGREVTVHATAVLTALSETVCPNGLKAGLAVFAVVGVLDAAAWVKEG